MTEQFKDILNAVRPDILENPDVDLIEDGIIDSLDVMNLVAELENAYGFDFDPDDVSPENFASAENVWKLVLKYTRGGG
jgi:acyl carrier protein